MDRWEYKTITIKMPKQLLAPEFDAPGLDLKLNDAASEGWEVVAPFECAFGGTTRSIHVILRREREEPKPPPVPTS